MKLNKFRNWGATRYILVSFILLSSLILLSVTKNTLAAAKVNSSAPIIILQTIKLVSLLDGTNQIQLGFSAPIVEPKTFFINTPPQLVLDFAKVKNSSVQTEELIKQITQSQLVKSITAYEAQGRTRLMLYLKQPANYKLTHSKNNFFIDLTTKIVAVQAAAQIASRQIDKIDFRKNAVGGGQIIFDITDTNTDVNFIKAENRLMITLKDTNVQQILQKRYDVTDFGTGIKFFDVSMQGKSTRVVVDVKGNYDPASYLVNKQLIIDIKPDSNSAKAVDGQSGKLAYNGKMLSLNFQDVKVRAVLQIIAEFIGMNIVSSDKVNGNITLHLNNVPWDQALDIILKSQGLGRRQIGNVLLIAPAEDIALREKQELQAQQQVSDLEPVQSALIQINYGKATDIVTMLKDKSNSLLSARGAVSADVRTNSLWVQDTPTKLNQVRDLLQRLDVPVKQVLIEARMVNMSKNYEEDLGIRFGLSQGNHMSGNLASASLAANNTPQTDATQRLNLNLQATPSLSSSAPATLGLAMMRLGSTGAFLDLELSALEVENKGKILASPRLVTADQQAATIETGQDIPYQEASSSGAATTSFKKAVLGLTVTPQITPDNRIMLNIMVNQDADSGERVNGVPVIDTRKITTKILVNNGETLVLGGIYQQNEANSVQRIPFLGKLPILGALFRNTSTTDERQEMIIFVTPKIIEQGTEENK